MKQHYSELVKDPQQLAEILKLYAPDGWSVVALTPWADAHMLVLEREVPRASSPPPAEPEKLITCPKCTATFFAVDHSRVRTPQELLTALERARDAGDTLLKADGREQFRRLINNTIGVVDLYGT